MWPPVLSPIIILFLKNLKQKCLELWEVNYDVRRVPFIGNPQDSFDSLVSGPKNFLHLSPEVLNKGNLRRRVISVYDWHCVLLSNSQHPTYFLSYGQVYEYVRNRWVTNTYLNISPGTLIYGELATELQYSDIKQRTVRVLHIIDAYKLGNVDISNEHYLSRIQFCKDFAKSMNKIESNQIQIRVKEPENMENITDILKKIDRRWSKCHHRLVKTYELDREKYCYASGILFIKATLSPWVRTLSDTHNSMYYRHPTKQSIYERANPVAAYAHFGECCSTNKMWLWMDKSGNTLKTLNPKLQLEPKDFDKFRLIK